MCVGALKVLCALHVGFVCHIRYTHVSVIDALTFSFALPASLVRAPSAPVSPRVSLTLPLSLCLSLPLACVLFFSVARTPSLVLVHAHSCVLPLTRGFSLWHTHARTHTLTIIRTCLVHARTNVFPLTHISELWMLQNGMVSICRYSSRKTGSNSVYISVYIHMRICCGCVFSRKTRLEYFADGIYIYICMYVYIYIYVYVYVFFPFSELKLLVHKNR